MPDCRTAEAGRKVGFKKIPPLSLKKDFLSQLIMTVSGAESSLIWVGNITSGGLIWKVNKLIQVRTHLAGAYFMPGECWAPADRGHGAGRCGCRGAGGHGPRGAGGQPGVNSSSSRSSCSFHVHFWGSYPRYIIAYSSLFLVLSPPFPPPFLPPLTLRLNWSRRPTNHFDA